VSLSTGYIVIHTDCEIYVVHEGKHLFIVLLVSETARKLLKKEKKLTKTTDDNGWSPLHYAAYFSTWLNISVVKVLLKYDASAAYIAETEKKRTALHIAAIQGHVNAMKEIVS
jgi:ankyrin repeat protein